MQKAAKSFFRRFFILIESNRNSYLTSNNQIIFRFKCFKNSFFIAIETLKQPYIFSQMKKHQAQYTFFIYILNLISFKNNILQNSPSEKCILIIQNMNKIKLKFKKIK